MPTGNIAAAVQAGFPQTLVIPIAPYDAPFEPALRGKIPAYFGYNGWIPKTNWQLGVAYEESYNSDQHGCNAGLVLGVSNGGFNFVAIDVDTNPHDTDEDAPETLQAWQICGVVVTSVVAYLRSLGQEAPLWTRMTRPGRVSILFTLPPDVHAGKKGVAFLSGPNGEEFGKIEVLAHGQQSIIGGTHAYQGGTQITWRDGSRSDSKSYSYPPLSQGCASITDRKQLDALLNTVLNTLRTTMGLCSTDRRSQFTSDSEAPVLSPEDQAPVGVAEFCKLFTALPHDSRVTRETYVKTMLAASASIRAAKSILKATPEQVHEMETAVVDWAARWEDPKGVGTTQEQEFVNWNRDFSLRHVNSLGWRSLVSVASDLGNTDVKFWTAQAMFPVTTEAPPPEVELLHTKPNALVASGDKPQEGVPVARRGSSLRFDVKCSDIQIADYVENSIGSGIVWVPEQNEWLVWSGVEGGGWSAESGSAIARNRIADQLVFYVDQNMAAFGNNEGTKVKLTSEARVAAIEKLLKSRLAMLSRKLSATKLTLQTPKGMFNLATGQALSWQEQRASYEQRSTLVAPAPGPTPLFDSILDHLACGDAEVVSWLWAYLGYAASGDPVEHLMLIITGPGENGKSKLANILRRILGSYAGQIDRRVLTQSGKGDHPTGLYDIKGKRLWCVSEFQENEAWNEAQIKAMTGGDPINARGMHQNMKSLDAEGVFLIYTNYVPTLEKISNAIIRRFRILNARMPVPAEKKNRRIEEEIMETEASAILYKIMLQAKTVLANGGQMPETPASIVAETKQYFQAQDLFHSWFSGQCEVVLSEAEELIDLDELYKRYTSYVARQNSTGKLDDLGMAEEVHAAPDQLGVMGFISGLKRSGALVDLKPVDAKAVVGGTAQTKKVVRGIRLKVKIV